MKPISSQFRRAIVFSAALTLTAWTSAQAIVVGYYTDQNTGDTGPVYPITVAGYTPQQITTLATANLNALDVLMIDEFSNSGYSADLVGALPAVEAWVRAGGRLVVHDRSIAGVVPDRLIIGATNTPVARYQTNNDDIILPDTVVSAGPFGSLNNTSLDGGNSSSHGYVRSANLPSSARSIISVGGQPTNVVAFAYTLGAGGIYYSTIPLDYYLNNANLVGQPSAVLAFANVMKNIYTPNVLYYAVGEFVPPTVAITAPAALSEFNTNAIAVFGSASDNKQLTRVLVSLNGGAFSDASLVSPSPTHGDWTKEITLVPGTNTVAVKSMDAAGNTSRIETRKFFYRVGATLSVNVTGLGSVTPNLNGSNLFIGRAYTMVATPASNYLFSNWVSSATAPTGSPRLRFLMQSNLVLTANFVQNRFLAAAGNYYGLFYSNSTYAEQREGFISLRMTAMQGRLATFSGTVLVDGDSIPFTGQFDLSGSGTPSRQLTRRGKSPLVLALQLPFDGSDTLQGNVSSPLGGWTDPTALSANRSVFTTMPAHGYAGKYTMLLPGASPGAPSPTGDGYASLEVGTNGFVRVAGRLGDDQLLQPQSAPVSRNGLWPFYAPVYPSSLVTASNGTIRTHSGVVIGWVSFFNNVPLAVAPENQLMANVPSGMLSWVKTGWTNGYYDAGFTNDVYLQSSAYYPPVSGQRGLFITNGAALWSGGNITGTLQDDLIVNDNNLITVAPRDYHAGFSFLPSSGIVVGHFNNPANSNKTTQVHGVYLQNSLNNFISGEFLGTNQSGLFQILPGVLTLP